MNATQPARKFKASNGIKYWVVYVDGEHRFVKAGDGWKSRDDAFSNKSDPPDAEQWMQEVDAWHRANPDLRLA